MNTLNLEIGHRIKQKRNALKYSQRKVSGIVGINVATFNKIEAGVGVKVDLLVKIADCLDTNIDFLINGEKEKETQMIVIDADDVNSRLSKIEQAIILMGEAQKMQKD